MGASAQEFDNWQKENRRGPYKVGKLEHRYDVKKVNDPTGKHDECPYFVLDIRHDEAARFALRAYGAYMKMAGDFEFGQELTDLAEKHRTNLHEFTVEVKR